MASLTTSTNTGTQTTTQTPQPSVGTSGGASTQSGNVQPGTANTLLNSTKPGVSLQGNKLTTVNLGSRTAQVSQFSLPKQPHTNPALYGLAGVIIVIAIATFVASLQAAKNTTK